MKITLNIEKNEIESLVKDYVKKTLNINTDSNLEVTITDNGITVVSDTIPKKEEEEKIEEVKAETKKENNNNNNNNNNTDSISAILNSPVGLFN